MTSGAQTRDGRLWRGPARRTWLVAIALLLFGSVLPIPAAAEPWSPPSTVYIEPTGHTIDGLFLQYWRDHRALIGDPITEEITAKTKMGAAPDDEQIVQYYENAALVYLPEEAAGSQVQLLDLGRETLDRALDTRPSGALVRATRRTGCGATLGSACRGFGITGHTLTGNFRAFWDDTRGEAGLPLSEAFRAPDGTWVQYFERTALRLRADQDVVPLPLGLTTAKRSRLETERITRPEAIPVYAPDLFVAPPEPIVEPVVAPPEPIVEPVVEPIVEPEIEPAWEPEPIVEQPLGWTVGSFGPGPQQGGYKEIVVSISAQAVWAYENGELLQSSYVSTGTADVPMTVTPIGYHQVLSKYDVQNMEGTISDEYYFVADVPNILYFDNLGNALHGTYWHNNFGTPMSHGCVNLPLDLAAWMFNWAPVGTPVTVIA